jgi:hypothetical protein
MSRRSVLRASLGAAAAWTLARPYIAHAAATTATVWWVQGFAEEEDVSFKKIVADYEKASGNRLCQLSRLLIDAVSAILPRAQAVSRMPSAITALRMCCQRRVAAGTRWRVRDRQRRKFRSSSWPRQYRLADPVLFNPSIGRHRPLMPR